MHQNRNTEFCRETVERTVRELGKLDVLVSNAAFQNRREKPEEVSDDQWERTFRVNVLAMFYTVKAALKHLKPGAAIINVGSIQAYEPSPPILGQAFDAMLLTPPNGFDSPPSVELAFWAHYARQKWLSCHF